MVQIILAKELAGLAKEGDLYIPHGSDNTASIQDDEGRIFEALYPTWFR